MYILFFFNPMYLILYIAVCSFKSNHGA